MKFKVGDRVVVAEKPSRFESANPYNVGLVFTISMIEDFRSHQSIAGFGINDRYCTHDAFIVLESVYNSPLYQALL